MQIKNTVSLKKYINEMLEELPLSALKDSVMWRKIHEICCF